MADIIFTLGSFSDVATSEGQDPYFTAEDPTTSGYLPPVYVFDDYSVTVNISVIDNDDVNPESFTITSLTLDDNSDLSLFEYSISGSSFTITTGVDSPFDDYFQFMYYDEGGNYAYRDDWSPQEAIDNGFLSIVKWDDPSQSVVGVLHGVTVTATGSQGSNFIGGLDIPQNLYFKYPPYTAYVVDLSERTQETQANIIGPMISVLTGDEYNYYVDDQGNILEYFIATEAYDGIAIGETYILDGPTKVRFDPPDYLGNGADFTKNGTDFDTAKNILIELGLYQGA